MCSLSKRHRHSLMSFAVVALVGMHAKAQVSVTATLGTPGPTNYATVSAAFDAINAGTHQGSVVITLVGNTTEPTSPGALRSSGTGGASYTDVLIRPQGDRVINGLPNAARGILQFNGADNVTLDGDDPNTPGERNLIIQAAAPSSQAGIGVVRFASATASSDGATNNILRNCILIGSRSGASSTLNSYGVYVGSSGQGDMFNTGSSWNCDGITIENNVIQRCFYGIYFAGNTAGPADGTVIRRNRIESPTAADGVAYRGILLRNTPSALVDGNAVSMWTTGGNTGPAGGNTVVGVALEEGTGGTVVNANRIEDLLQGSSTSLGCYGIWLSSATGAGNIRITNNFIRDVRNWNTNGAYTFASSSDIAVGIRVSANTSGLVILHNSISLSLPNTNSAQPSFSACIQYTGSVNGSVVRNNILSNTQASSITASRHFAVMAPSNAALGTIDHNAYYTPGAIGFVAYNGADRASLTTWTPVQPGSFELQPPFVSASDLHLDATGSNYAAFVGAGASSTGVTADIDGDPRNDPPALGADEPACGPAPFAAVSGGGTYCSDQSASVVFTFTGTAPFTFSYTDGSTTVTVTDHPSSSFTINAPASGSYAITALSDAVGCPPNTLGGSVVVVRVEAPDAGTGGALTVCSNAQPVLLLSALGGTPSGGGVWTGPSPVVGGSFDPSSMVGGAYTYTVTGTAPCANAIAVVTITVDPCLGIPEIPSAPLRWLGQEGEEHVFEVGDGRVWGVEVWDAAGRSVPATLGVLAEDRVRVHLLSAKTGIHIVRLSGEHGPRSLRVVHAR